MSGPDESEHPYDTSPSDSKSTICESSTSGPTIPSSPAAIPIPQTLKEAAAILDALSAERSTYRRYTEGRELLLGPSDTSSNLASTIDEDLPDGDPESSEDYELDVAFRAAWWSLRYHIDLTGPVGSERVELVPEFEGPDTTEPPVTSAVGSEIRDAWHHLSETVVTPAAQARLQHLLFQVGGRQRREHAQQATDAYMNLATTEARHLDAVEALRVAVRLSRAVKDPERSSVAMGLLVAEVEKLLDLQKPPQVPILRALRTLVGEGCPGSTMALLERASTAWLDANQADGILALRLTATTNPTEREAIWEQRVTSFIDQAEREQSNIVKSVRLRQALELAEKSGMPGLREKATVLLQTVGTLDLEMMSIKATSRQFQEQWEICVDDVIGIRDGRNGEGLGGGDSSKEGAESSSEGSWTAALQSFAAYPAVTGAPETSRRRVEEQNRLAPLTALLQAQLHTPEGLPLYTAETDQQRFEMDMVRWEVQLLEHWAPVLATSLHKLVEQYGLPPMEDLTHFLDTGPAMTTDTADRLCRAFYRYWAGDAEAAAYTVAPVIEQMLRRAVLEADRGIYRLQRNQSPGQYVGLGVLLDLFCDAYDADEAEQRLFSALLRHPAGWNVRNLMAHGYLDNIGSSVAAVLLHVALKVLMLSMAGIPEQSDA